MVLVSLSRYETYPDERKDYYSIPIKEEDRHITTFGTPYGRFRYKVLPLGFLAFNDVNGEDYGKKKDTRMILAEEILKPIMEYTK